MLDKIVTTLCWIHLYALDLDRKRLFLEDYYTMIGCHGTKNAKHENYS